MAKWFNYAWLSLFCLSFQPCQTQSNNHSAALQSIELGSKYNSPTELHHENQPSFPQPAPSELNALNKVKVVKINNTVTYAPDKNDIIASDTNREREYLSSNVNDHDDKTNEIQKDSDHDTGEFESNDIKNIFSETESRVSRIPFSLVHANSIKAEQAPQPDSSYIRDNSPGYIHASNSSQTDRGRSSALNKEHFVDDNDRLEEIRQHRNPSLRTSAENEKFKSREEGSHESKSDLWDLTTDTPHDFKQNDGEKLKQHIYDVLSLDPDRAQIPSGQMVQEEGTELVHSATESNATNSALDQKNTFVQDGSAQEESRNMEDMMSVDTAGMDGKNNLKDDRDQQEENNGRKILNDIYNEAYNVKLNTNKIKDDDFEYNFNDAYNDDDEEYIGGVVLVPSSKLVTSTSFGADDSVDFEQPKSNPAETGNHPKSVHSSDQTGMDEFDDDGMDYASDDDKDWYYNPEQANDDDAGSPLNDSLSSQSGSSPMPEQMKAGDSHNSFISKPEESQTQIDAPDFKENKISLEDVHTKKALQAPKGTIILYTALIVILIAGVVIFSIWKNPFQQRNTRSAHLTTPVRTSEEGKRLLDYPFV